MRAKSMFLILIALGCGLVASIAISQVLERGGNSGGSGLEMVQIYVATNDLDVNEQLTAANVRVEDWPKTKVPEGAITEFDEIGEHFARVRLYTGEPILTRMLAGEISGPAIKIPDGHRVFSIPVQMDTAVSYLVKPGDRVDIFGYFKKGKDVPTTGTRQILSNVRVFAVNSETGQDTADEDGTAMVAKTVSLLVGEKQVAKLMLATELGTLSLALRHPNETQSDAEVASETASIESLFGGKSESADQKEETPNQPGQLASNANSFVKFLTGLSQPAPAGGMPVQPGAAWQMTVLTPNGGEEFTWNNENELPVSGSEQNSSGSNRNRAVSGNNIATWQPPSDLPGVDVAEPEPNMEPEDEPVEDDSSFEEDD